MFCVAPLCMLALGLLLLNESLSTQLWFPHAPALTHTYLYTHVPAPSWTEPARSPRPPAALGFVCKAASPWEALHVRGALYPQRDRLSLTWAVLWVGRAVTSLPPCPPTPGLFKVCLEARILVDSLPAVRTRASGEHWGQHLMLNYCLECHWLPDPW